MSFLGRLFLFSLCPLGVLLAQETPTPTPTAAPVAEANPAPTASTLAGVATPPSSDTTPPMATPSPASASDLPPAPAEASPSASASPTPTPSPSPDVIPLDSQQTSASPSPAQAAPLDTQNLAPALPERSAADKAMPDAAFTDPNAIIPDQPPQPPGLPQSAENSQEVARKLSIRYHEVRVEADKDPQVLRMYERSTTATTDEDRRAALREYYRLLFKKIVSLDKSLDDKCQKLEAAYERRLAQQRMEPTIPLNPPPTPEPLHN